MLDLADKNIKTAIINMFREVKETMLKALKRSRMTVIWRIKNFHKEIIIIKGTNKNSIELKYSN